jgi:hypothetical protein
MSAVYANSSNQIASLKELYKDDKRYMQDLVYKENPLYALLPKDESPGGFEGKYIPVPLRFGNPQGRSHTFSNAQGNQTATSLDSFFVYVISDYQLVTITNLLMEQTKSNAGAFVDAAKLQIDGGLENIANNTAFELFQSGTATRGISAASSSQSGANPNIVTITLTNSSAVVQFEVGQTLVASTTDGGAPSADTVQLTNVDRITGVLIGTGSSTPAMSSNWGIGSALAYLTVQGDLPATGASSTGSFLAISGLAAWIPFTDPSLSDSFWGVNRSSDPTRLAGLRYNAAQYTIEEGLTNALALLNREGGKPDMCIINFTSYAALVNSLGAKVQYVQIEHDEVEVAFEGIRFHSAYGVVTVLADRSCPSQTCYLLSMDTWQLRSLGKVPHILTYGMEGLEGLRVGNADALEVRIGQYCNLVCNAPGRNMVVTLSA